MAEAIKYSSAGAEIGKVELPKELFEATAKNPDAVLYEVINMYLANQRQGTSSVKNRAEVNGSTRKLYRQKGTGNARPGSKKTPVRVGGGIAFGPQPKDWYKKIPKKKKRLALKLALTQRAELNQIILLDKLQFENFSVKQANEVIKNVAAEQRKILVIVDGSDPVIVKSFNNIADLDMVRADGINPYQILNSRFLVITEDALNKMKEVFTNE